MSTLKNKFVGGAAIKDVINLLDVKQRITRLQPTNPELGKKEDPKREMHGGSLERKIVKIFWVNWERGKKEGVGRGRD